MDNELNALAVRPTICPSSSSVVMTVKALSAAGMPLKTGDPVRVRWATADACVYTQWTESDLNKAAGAH